MPLTPGTRLGPYEVLGKLGEGGMGEVYRARDTRLDRVVALKILPDIFADDPDRLARFEREARTLASLNHPNIAHIHGLEEAPSTSLGQAGVRALVMELVEGEELSAHIARGPMPVDDVVPIARQIVEALEAAHEQGIIHRDLKPGNIKVRPDGTVKVLDFGLAKALTPDAASAELMNSPTLTSPMTQMGVILGTAAYMAPEQAKGKPVDKRADIWAFGCVLFEMLTGVRPFAGEDITDTFAAIVRADPDWSALPPDTPPALRRLLRRCLEKDRRERLPDIGAARLELKDAQRFDAVGEPAVLQTNTQASRVFSILPWMLFAGALVAVAAMAYVLWGRPASETPFYKAAILPPSPLSGAPALRFQISPDGRRLAFVAPDDTGRTVLWIRALDSESAQPLAGTSNASSPFWSPDSRWVAFTADGKLKKVDASGGAVGTICAAAAFPPGTWNADDLIVFTSTSGRLAQVPAAGGAPVDVTRLADGERAHIAPFFLPDGRHFLYTVTAAPGQGPGVFVASLDSPDATRLLDQPSNVAYADGYLLFHRETTLMAQRFDAEAFTLSGAAVPVAERLQINPNTGTGAFSVSRSGVLVYQTGTSAGTQLTWFSRTGEWMGAVGEARDYRDIELSPDGRWVSATVVTGGESDVWLIDVARNLPRRFTFGQGGAMAAVWSPDSRSIVYAARRAAKFDLYRRAATGGGREELLLEHESDALPLGFTPDGQTLLFRVPRLAASGELWLLPLSGERTPRTFSSDTARNVPAAVSPNGKWLAYVSEETMRRQVFVTSFPDNIGRWQVSTEGGDNPRWRADGKELYFTTTDRLMAVDVVASEAQFDAGPVRELFEVRVPSGGLATRSTFAVTASGDRFLVNTWDPRGSLTPITLVVNWVQGLGR